MFVPYSTDAPIYHWPAATVGLIVVNVVAFLAMTVALESAEDAEAIMPYVLHLGRGIYPWQWLTANFLHANLLHLMGNMLGLWTFGLVVEGKVGWGWFLGVYLGLGVVVLAITQILSLGMAENFGLGASGIIYGLVALGLVWAPENEVSCFVLLLFRPIVFEIRIWVFAVIYMVIQLLLRRDLHGDPTPDRGHPRADARQRGGAPDGACAGGRGRRGDAPPRLG